MERRSNTPFGPFNNDSANGGIRRRGAHAFAFGLAFATAALACAGAGAETAERTTIAVPYGDLDVAHQAGARVLLHRLRVAARKVCGLAPDIRDLTVRPDYDRCMDQAVGGAVTELDMPLLVELYREPGAMVTEHLAAK